MRSLLSGLFAVGVLALLVPAARGDDLGDLLRRLPPAANTAVALNIKAIRQMSGRTVGADATGFEIVAGVPVPPVVDLVVYATHIEPGMMDSRKTLGLIRMNRPVTLDDLAYKTDGKQITVAGTKVVDSLRKGYFVDLGDNVWGLARAVNRQELARWMQFTKSNSKPVLPAYLASALGAGDAPVFGAIDMEHMIDPKALRDRLNAVDDLAGTPAKDLDAAAEFLAGLKGVSLSVRGRALDEAEVRLDFTAPADKYGEVVRSVFLSVLDELGAAMNDFRKEKVTATADGTAVKLTVKLSSTGLNRIMSVFMPATPSMKADAAPPVLESNGASKDVTQRYYRTVRVILDELNKDMPKGEKQYQKTAAWYDADAKRLEQLSTQYVDEDVAKFGQSVATRLRSISYSLRGVVVESNSLGGGLVHQVTASWGGWLGWGGGDSSTQVVSNAPQIRERQADAIAKGATQRLATWETINQDRRALVKTINERYGLKLE